MKMQVQSKLPFASSPDAANPKTELKSPNFCKQLLLIPILNPCHFNGTTSFCFKDTKNGWQTCCHPWCSQKGESF